ncbi:TIGR02679 family protein [Ornithinimicrobium cerasi]|uniref:TIGR02679 family protein n=1 Tax=Ornithinimicrobium cerasi TaxID=2248773 RepID=A0A285VM12_9MICO|nr:TIGR02679 family protein [Ornithinimicrobium cerasi]SOC53611.1 TIGR02679 family protein [Ornithinimicrobium cerasi]
MSDRSPDARDTHPPRREDLPDWVRDPALGPTWERVLVRLERGGLLPQGYVVLAPVSRAERHAVAALLGRPTVRERQRVNLAELDERLRERSGVGGLVAVVTALTGRTPQDRPARRAERDTARETPLALAAELVGAPWVHEWVSGLRRTGLLTGRADAEQVVRDAARVLAELPAPGAARHTVSRVELGARLLGDAHALDRGTLLHHVLVRALAAAGGRPDVPASARGREELWAAVGVAPDLVSRTCLVLGLRVDGRAGLARRLEVAAEEGDPVHVTDWDLRRAGPLVPVAGTRVLVCENPRVLEAVAERGPAGWAVVCTSGEPNLVVDQMLRGLAEAGLRLRYHGDFDWPGISLVERAIGRYGVQPWRMSVADYLDGLVASAPELAGRPVEPSWDVELGAAMRSHGRVVHEETVVGALLDAMEA